MKGTVTPDGRLHANDKLPGSWPALAWTELLPGMPSQPIDVLVTVRRVHPDLADLPLPLGERSVILPAEQVSNLLSDLRSQKARNDGLLAMLNRAFEERRGVEYQVREFHLKKGQPVLKVPQVPSDARVRLRCKLLVDECFEFVAACGVDTGAIEAQVQQLISDTETFRVDLPEAVDALVDMNYVNAGSFHEFGVKSFPCAVEVHRTNMAKEDHSKNDDGKVIKPEGWQPPDIRGCLMAQGWDGKDGTTDGS